MQNMVMMNTIASCLSYLCYIFLYILLIVFFYDWFKYNPKNTCVLIDCIQCKNSQVLKATLSVLTCEVYHPDSGLTNIGFLFLDHS